MTNKKLVTTGLITALLVSNLVIGWQYTKDSKEYEEKLTHQIQISKYRQGLINDKTLKIDVLMGELKKKDSQINKQTSTINTLKQQLEKAKKRNESPSVNVSRGTETKPKIHMVATAYVSYCKGCIGITTGGINVRKSIEHNGMRVIAVDPNVIPLHSIVKIYTKNGSFLAYAGDTGSAIKGYKLDLLIDIHNEQKAFEFGIQDVSVSILREGKG